MAATTVEITKALEAAWNALRAHHPSLPKTVFTIVSRASDQGGAIDVGPRVFLAENILTGGGQRVFEVLAHQAAHVLAQDRGIADTSGPYHNNRFGALAEELGLAVVDTYDRRHGRAETVLPPAMAKQYSFEINMLDELLKGYVVHTPPLRDTFARPRGLARRDQIKVRCDCRSFRIAEASFNIAPIRCVGCKKNFWRA